MRYFPVFIDTQTMQVLVVGAGEVAARKLELILKSEASVTVVAPWMCDTVKSYANNPRVTLVERPFADDDLNDINMVFVATNDGAVNEYVHDQARARGVLVNVVDNTPLCQFITPSIIDRSPIVIAMSSGGVAQFCCAICVRNWKRLFRAILLV